MVHDFFHSGYFAQTIQIVNELEYFWYNFLLCWLFCLCKFCTSTTQCKPAGMLVQNSDYLGGQIAAGEVVKIDPIPWAG